MATHLESAATERMMGSCRISDRLSRAAESTFVGRQNELSMLAHVMQADELPVVVTFVHGPGGIGKSRLVKAALDAAAGWIRPIVMDCRSVEPTPPGFQSALGRVLGLDDPAPSLRAVTERLGAENRRVVISLDTYETFGLMDTWLRQDFFPSLPVNVFTIIAGREAPNAAWYTSPGWQQLFRDIQLAELSPADTQEMLESRGLTSQQIQRINRFARGYPLVLEMAAAAIRTQPELEVTDGPPPKVIQQLTRVFLGGLPPAVVTTVEAASAVRRVTEPMLRVLLAVSDVREEFECLRRLPFVNATTEGLLIHDVVRETISKELAWRDPQRYRMYRRRAWAHLSEQSQHAAARTLWQYTADLLYMIENPVVREAFFPAGAGELHVEPAVVSDDADIREIAEEVEPAESVQLLMSWWRHHPEIFHVVRSRDARTEGFYVLFEPKQVDARLLAEDPLTAYWLHHLEEKPISEGERVLFCRRWLARSSGEAPSPAVSASFLDIKRTYMEMRPSLRRLYFPVTDFSTYKPLFKPLGFNRIDDASATIGGTQYCSVMNDFGPDSVDGWLAKIAGQELGMDPRETDRTDRGIAGPDRRLITVLFTDIVGATQKAVELGDSRWLALIESHHAIVRKELARFHGREIDTAGDGFFSTFERPIDAIHCACAIRDAVRSLGIEIRAGLHLGECEVVGKAVRGITVHIGARVAANAGTGNVFVSSTVKDVLAGAGIVFEDRGAYELKGIPGRWNLHAVVG